VFRGTRSETRIHARAYLGAHAQSSWQFDALGNAESPALLLGRPCRPRPATSGSSARRPGRAVTPRVLRPSARPRCHDNPGFLPQTLGSTPSTRRRARPPCCSSAVASVRAELTQRHAPPPREVPPVRFGDPCRLTVRVPRACRERGSTRPQTVPCVRQRSQLVEPGAALCRTDGA
jgi:hypothetical protein